MRLVYGLATAVALAGGCLAGVIAAADSPPAVRQGVQVVRLGNASCPVTGAAVDFRSTMVWNGVEIGFSSAEAKASFTEDALRYVPSLLRDLATQLTEAKARLAALQAASPASSRLAQPPPSAIRPSSGAVEVVDLHNTTCPVTGTPALPAMYADYRGVRVHFADAKSYEAFLANPEGYMPNLRGDPVVGQTVRDAESRWASAGLR